AGSRSPSVSSCDLSTLLVIGPVLRLELSSLCTIRCSVTGLIQVAIYGCPSQVPASFTWVHLDCLRVVGKSQLQVLILMVQLCSIDVNKVVLGLGFFALLIALQRLVDLTEFFQRKCLHYPRVSPFGIVRECGVAFPNRGLVVLGLVFRFGEIGIR